MNIQPAQQHPLKLEHRVQETGEQEVKVMGLKSTDQLKKIFQAQEDDLFDVEESDILAILPESTFRNVGTE